MMLLLSLLTSGLCLASPAFYGPRYGQEQEVLVYSGDMARSANPMDYNKLRNRFTLNATFDTINLNTTANRTLDHTTMPFLDFDRLLLINTTNAAREGYLHPNDTNCAHSLPNALHSILPAHRTPAVFRSNPSALAAHNASEFYNIRAFAVKPVGELKQGAAVKLTPWTIEGDKPSTQGALSVRWGRAGHVSPVFVEPGRFFPWWGQRVNWVEIEAFTLDGEPLEFCLDDLLLEFHDL